MGDFLQSIFLSNVMIFLGLGVVLLLITSWAIRLGEIPGYILGWLVGIFMIILLSTLSPGIDPLMNAPIQTEPVSLTFLGIIIPSFIGLVLGIGVLSLIRFGSSSPSRIGRALTIAILLAITLVSAYLMLQSAMSARLSIAIFMLTFGIGALVNYIFRRGGIPTALNLRSRLPFRDDL